MSTKLKARIHAFKTVANKILEHAMSTGNAPMALHASWAINDKFTDCFLSADVQLDLINGLSRQLRKSVREYFGTHEREGTSQRLMHLTKTWRELATMIDAVATELEAQCVEGIAQEKRNKVV